MEHRQNINCSRFGKDNENLETELDTFTADCRKAVEKLLEDGLLTSKREQKNIINIEYVFQKIIAKLR